MGILSQAKSAANHVTSYSSAPPKRSNSLIDVFGDNSVSISTTEWQTWVKNNGLSAMTYAKYYLRADNITNPSDAQRAYVLTQILHDVLAENLLAQAYNSSLHLEAAAKRINYKDYSITFEQTQKNEIDYNGNSVKVNVNVYRLFDKNNKEIGLYEDANIYRATPPANINEKMIKGGNWMSPPNPFAIVKNLFAEAVSIH